MKKYTLAFSLQKCPLTTEDISRLLSHYCCHKKRPLNSILCVEAYSYCAKVLHCKIWPFHYSSSICVYSLKEISDIHQKKKKGLSAALSNVSWRNKHSNGTSIFCLILFCHYFFWHSVWDSTTNVLSKKSQQLYHNNCFSRPCVMPL